jgi:V/A-type H+-transporting ATPase subunit C
MRRYTAEQNLFPLEVALDLFYWRRMWGQIALLQGEDRTQGVKIVGALVDMNNLMWAIRYKVYHQLSEEELINYTLPFGYRVKDEDIRGVAAGVDIAQIVERVYPELEDVDEILRDPRKGLPHLEVLLQRRLARQCNAAFASNPFTIGIPLAYLILSQLEIQDLTVLMEAKSTNVPADEFRPLLIGSAARV